MVIVPAGTLHIQNGLADPFERPDVPVEGVLNLLEPAGDIRTLAPSKAWHGPLLALGPAAEVDLPLGHLQQVLAPLDEGVHLGKDAGLVQDPLYRGVGGVEGAGLPVDALPGLAAVNALLEDQLTPLYVAIKQVVQRHLLKAPLDDLAAYLT